MSGDQSAAQVVARIAADLSQLKSGYAEAKSETTSLGGWFKSTMSSVASTAGGVLAAFGIQAGIGALVGGIKQAITSAGDFQAQITSLETGAGESANNLGMVSQALLKMAVDTGTTTQQLTSGLYMIESAGYHGAAGLQVLLAAAEGAKVGDADLGVVADATTTILTDFGKTGITASQAVNLLIGTVASGKTHMQDLAGAMSQILPTAEAAKVKLTDVMAAMATMTAEGVPAADAATYLRQMLLALDAPGSKAVSTLDSIGLKASDVSAEMQISLPGALQMITDALAKKFPVGSAAYVQALKDITGGSKNLQGMLDLTGDHLGTFQTNVKNLTGDVKTGGDKITGWNKVQDDFNQKIAKASEVGETLGIKLGTVLLPVIANLAGWMADHVAPALSNVVTGLGNFISWVENAQTNLAWVLPWWQAWGPLIETVGGAITLFFLPAIIKSGGESVIAGGKIAANFIMSIINSGKEAVIAAGKLWGNAFSWVASIDMSGQKAEETAGEVDTMTASEQAAGEASETSATQMAALSLAEDAEGTSAVGASTQLDGLAASEAAAGDAAEGATGAAGAGAAIGGGGILGLAAGFAALIAGSSAATLSISEDLIGSLTGLKVHVFDPIGDVQQLVGWIQNLGNDSSTAAAGTLDLAGALFQMNINLIQKPGQFRDIDGNLIDLKNYADDAAVALHNLDVQWANMMFGGTGFGPPQPGAPPPAHGPRAAGGPVFAGGSFLVGEEGRELFVPPQNGTMLNHQQTEQVLAGSSHTTHNQTINLYGPTSDQLMQQLSLQQAQQQALAFNGRR